jgi:hypothetical protein
MRRGANVLVRCNDSIAIPVDTRMTQEGIDDKSPVTSRIRKLIIESQWRRADSISFVNGP